MVCKYRVVLSIDGGGIKGVVPLKILTALQNQIAALDNEVKLSSLVDVVAGSSTGTIIGASMLMHESNGDLKFTPGNMLDIYKKRGKQIFSRNVGLDPSNSVYPLSFILDHFFGGIRVHEINKRFLFVSYDLRSESQYLFTDTADRFRDLAMSKVLIACSAYPGLFPPLELGNLLLADGIVAAKNPTELAYNYARLFYPNDPLIVLSLGTGQNAYSEMDFIDKEMELVHQRMLNLKQIDSNLIYFRLQPELSDDFHADSEISDEMVDKLIVDTERYLLQSSAEMKRLLQLIKIKVDQLV